MTTFWGMSITRKILGASGILSALWALNACQTTSTLNTSDSKDVSFTATVAADRIPDSVSWNFNGKSGRGSITLLDASKLSYRLDFTLSEPPGSKPYDVTFWRLSVQLARLQVANGVYEQPTWRDTLGLVLLKRLDSLRATKDSASYPESVKSLIEIYATALIDGDTLFKGFPARTVTTLDTAAIYRAAIIQAAKRHQPYSILAASWGLGLDSLSTYNRLAKLVSANGPITPADSLAFFPPYPVRVGKALSVTSLTVRGESVPVNGSFVGDSGLSSYKVRILKGTDDKSDLFSITTQPAQLDGSQTTWDLATNARLTLQVKTAEVGSYTLEVSISDPRGRSDTSRTVFSVLPPPDKTGPNIEWVSPKSSLLLEYKDSIIVAKIKASDVSGIDSVWIDGKSASKTDSVWTVSTTIPVSDLGYLLKVKARDLAGNVTDSSLQIIRQKEPAAGAPIVRLVSPVSRNGNILPFDSIYLRLQWVIKDVAGIDTSSVTISGAKSVQHTDSLWSADVAIPATGQNVTITLEVKNTKGILASDFVNVIRARDTIKPVVLITRHADTLDFDSTLANFSFDISDNHKIQSVLIGDSVIGTEAKTYVKRASLVLGANLFLVTALDSTGNKTEETVSIFRRSDTTKPVIFRVNGTGPKDVKWADSIVIVEWIATDDGNRVQVRINGESVTVSQGKFSSAITLSKLGEQYIKIEATDRAGNISVDSIRIFRKSPVFTKIFNNGTGVLAALKEDGKLIIWGDTSNGMSNIPSNLHNIKDVSLGSTFVLALDYDNNIFGWGNTYGTVMDSVLSYKKAKIVMAGAAFAAIVTLDGKLRVWDAYDDPLVLTIVPPKLTGITALATGGRYILALDSAGKVWGWGDDIFSGPTIPNDLPKIKQVSAGLHSLALSETGKVYGWGDYFGVEPVPEITGSVIKVSAANILGLALLEDGTIKIWGEGSEVLNNYPRGTTRYTDAQITKSCGIALSEAGDLVVWGICKYPNGI